MRVVRSLFILISCLSYVSSSLHIFFSHFLEEHSLSLLHVLPGALPQ